MAERQERKQRLARDLVLPVEQIRAALPERLAVLLKRSTVRWGGHPAGPHHVGDVTVLLQRGADRLERMAHPRTS